KKKIVVETFDIFTYINSKFVYVERHARTQMTTLYRNLLKQKYDLEKQVLTNALILATLKPTKVYLELTAGGPALAGRSTWPVVEKGLTAGEVIHIIKCIVVDVRVRHTADCYNELPVANGNNSLFLTPKTHILTNHGTHRECSHVLPVMYEIEESWHRLSPRPIEVIPPQMLQPLEEPKWQYINPSNLATSGIYTQNNLNNLSDHIIFPAEKSAILNSVARTMTGKEIRSEGLSVI
ncbi:uncharacterized protein LOC144477472, partial [Augochlora pura]